MAKEMHKVKLKSRQNVSSEQRNIHLETQKTNPGSTQEQEMFNQDSFGNLTINKEEF